MTKQQETLLRKWQLLSPYLSRRQQSFWAAVEAEMIGPRGRVLLTRVTGISAQTLTMRTREMMLTKAAPLGSLVHASSGHYRSGRKLVELKDPDIENALELLVSNEIAGEPTNNQRWVRSSLRRLSAQLGRQGHQACTHTVARLLRKKGYSLRVMRKRHPGTQHPDRDKQFQYIATLKANYLAEGLPVISIDTKKKELVGNFRREGTSWQKEPIEVDAYYASARQCVAVPFGIYDVALNAGYVTVGISANTSEFAVNCLESWWRDYGRLAYPHGNRLLVFADGGGANGHGLRTWKNDIQERLCDAIGLTVTLSHYPPGCSRWNPVEYQLFSHISMNWAGRPLSNLDVMLALIRGTTTSSGLKVEARLDQRDYNKGRKVTQRQMKQLALSAHDVCPSWNYTLSPRLVLTSSAP